MSLQASVTLDRVFVQSVADPTIKVVGGSVSRSDETDLGGQFRTNAAGGVMMIVTPAKQRLVGFTLNGITNADAEVLRNKLIGQTVLLRDSYGLRVFGGFLSMTRVDIPLSGGLCQVQITLNATTYVEGV